MIAHSVSELELRSVVGTEIMGNNNVTGQQGMHFAEYNLLPNNEVSVFH